MKLLITLFLPFLITSCYSWKESEITYYQSGTVKSITKERETEYANYDKKVEFYPNGTIRLKEIDRWRKSSKKTYHVNGNKKEKLISIDKNAWWDLKNRMLNKKITCGGSSSRIIKKSYSTKGKLYQKKDITSHSSIFSSRISKYYLIEKDSVWGDITNKIKCKSEDIEGCKVN